MRGGTEEAIYLNLNGGGGGGLGGGEGAWGSKDKYYPVFMVSHRPTSKVMTIMIITNSVWFMVGRKKRKLQSAQ